MKSSNRKEAYRLIPMLILGAAFCFAGTAAGQTITTAAGGYVGDGELATAAAFNYPEYVVMDARGNLIVSDIYQHRVRKVDRSGRISTIVGTGIAGFNGDGIRAAAAQLDYPTGIALDAAGNLYIASQGQQRIRKVDTRGFITTVAGNGTTGYTGDGGLATNASLWNPFAVAVDSQGNLYFSDINNHAVRKVAAGTGIITTVAGTGTAGYSGDDGPATSATLNMPRGVLPDNAGNLYIADTANHRVRMVNLSTGIITTVAGNGLPGSSSDGPATATRIGNPRGLAFDRDGNLLISNAGGSRVRKVDKATQRITTIAGSYWGFDGDANTAPDSWFMQTTGLCLDASGNLIIVDSGNQRIRKIDTVSQAVTTIAGGYIGDGKKAKIASLNQPYNLALDAAGNTYIADTYNHRVRKVDPSGKITTVAGTGISGYNGDGVAASALLFVPSGVAVSTSGDLYIADSWNGLVRRVDASGNMTTLFTDYYADLVSMAFDNSGNLYVADDSECVIHKLDVNGNHSLVAGAPFSCGYNGDVSPAASTQLNGPFGVAVDGAGNLYIGDTYNNRVRKVDAAGNITTIVGNGTCGFSGDDGQAESAVVCYPMGLAVDNSGNLYIADQGNYRVRRVDANGIITTVAGTGLGGYNGDKLPATSANLDVLSAVAVDTQGNVYVADFGSMRIRKISPDRAK